MTMGLVSFPDKSSNQVLGIARAVVIIYQIFLEER